MAKLKRKLALFALKESKEEESKGEVVCSKYLKRHVLGSQENGHNLQIDSKSRTRENVNTNSNAKLDKQRSEQKSHATRRDNFFSQQYRILRLIGYGVYGNVYVAQNLSTSKFVAVKAQRLTAGKDPKVPYVR